MARSLTLCIALMLILTAWAVPAAGVELPLEPPDPNTVLLSPVYDIQVAQIGQETTYSDPATAYLAYHPSLGNLRVALAMEFDLPETPEGKVINDVELLLNIPSQVTVGSGDQGIGLVAVGFVGSGLPIFEDDMDAEELVGPLADNTIGEVTISLPPSFFRPLSGSANRYAGLVLTIMTPEASATVVTSQVNDTSGPRLRINYVPEPATLMLLGLGAVAVTRRRRRDN